ncbi:hypothetical protein [Legionella cardiaca]|uniref:VipA n=1 Tax=Legionella cardiaca TaxID=1071983 RepID=A0ABY8AVK8_9GAMM|nr:hypothetical protein [Legionella cardiaca]WED44474.1 hypothetical protein PXX05_06730 [Legionella cardiaca]
MSISKECHSLFEKLIQSYKISSDKAHHQIYPKLIAISKEISTQPELYNDQELIVRLSSSAIVFMHDNPHFATCLKEFLKRYEKKTNSLNFLVEGAYDADESLDEEIDDEERTSAPLNTTGQTKFFIELQEAIRKRALKLEQQEQRTSLKMT